MKTTLTTKITSYKTLSYETLYLVSFWEKKILVPQCKQIRLSNAFITFFLLKKGAEYYIYDLYWKDILCKKNEQIYFFDDFIKGPV